MDVVLVQANDTDAATESAVVHAAIQLPRVRLRVVDLDRLQVRRSVEAADRHQLSVDHCQTNLNNSIKTWFTV